MIADAVGLTQPGVFRHFPAKTDIWLAVGEWIATPSGFSASSGSISGKGAQDADPAAQLRQAVSRYFAGIARHPAIPAILFSRELHVENEALRAHFQRIMANRTAAFKSLIQRAQDMGQIVVTTDASDLAALILALIQGLAMRWSMEKHGFDLQAEGMRLLDGLLET